MPGFSDFFQQLKKRRVIRSSVVYVALVWVALQVADLLAESGLITEETVQLLILMALVGFPLTLLLSWFFETPWQQKKGLSVLGDIVIILAIVVGTGLLAWQQYLKSIARPTLAILSFEATDVRADTPDLGQHLSSRLRMLLATRPELSVTELASSSHPSLASVSMAGKASTLNADYLLTGTINQGDDVITLSLQLFDGQGELSWSETYQDQLLDQARMQAGILDDLWQVLPLPPAALVEAREIISECDYPGETNAIRAIISNPLLDSDQDTIENLSGSISRFKGNGMLHLARAKVFLNRLEHVPSTRRPIINNLVLQDVQKLEAACPHHPDAMLIRLRSTRLLQEAGEDHEAYLQQFPNSAWVYRTMAESMLNAGELKKALAYAKTAWEIDPLTDRTSCMYRKALIASDKQEALLTLDEFNHAHLQENLTDCV